MSEHLPRILDFFTRLARIPRCSGQEAGVRAWLAEWAAGRGLDSSSDRAGNLLVRVPASPGRERAPPLIIQGHMDMVCEKAPDVRHDFAADPIRLVREGDWLRADGTTLGADNGVALAVALALAEDPRLSRPPLELLFTCEEETGLVGAQKLEPGWLRGKTLINLDSEEDGVFIVGCAGGQETALHLPLAHAPLTDAYLACRLRVAGLRGGHSGIDIHQRRANANKILACALGRLGDDVRLVSLHGGTAHNAIPREAEALLALPATRLAAAQAHVAALAAHFQGEYADSDPGLVLELSPAGSPAALALDAAASGRVVDLLLALPHGVAARLQDLPQVVETSSNLALLRTEGAALRILSSQRSAVPARLAAHTRRVEETGRLAGAEVSSNAGYPAWQPRLDSPLLARARPLYQRLFGAAPRVEIIHAGLECGVLAGKYPDLDMLSYGPTIHNAHSPRERLFLPSLAKVYDFTAALLEEWA